MDEAISADIFKAHVDKTASLPDGQKLTLVAVDQHGSQSPGAPRTFFSLRLCGAPTPIVPEGMHRLTLEDGASFDLYIIPIHTPSRDRQNYQIVFN
jgi:hypothetical protein